MSDLTPQPGPGARLLGEHLGLEAPLDALAERHPPGDPLHRLARALRHSATELDAQYERAQQAGHGLRTLRTRRVERLSDPEATDAALAAAARELELAVEGYELMDTALTRLLDVYQDLAAAAVRCTCCSEPRSLVTRPR